VLLPPRNIRLIFIKLVPFRPQLFEWIVQQLVGVWAARRAVDVGFDVEFEAVGLVDLLLLLLLLGSLGWWCLGLGLGLGLGW
jgi:hypothetical protein